LLRSPPPSTFRLDDTQNSPHADDEQVARDVVAAYGREWLGHTLAVFVCGELGPA
jgi:hypothetical protein